MSGHLCPFDSKLNTQTLHIMNRLLPAFFMIALMANASFAQFLEWGVVGGSPWPFTKTTSVAVDSEGNYIFGENSRDTAVIGNDTVFVNGSSISWSHFLAKVDSSGNPIWTIGSAIPNADMNSVHDILTDPDDNIYAFCQYDFKIAFGNDTLTGGTVRNACLVKLDPNGNLLWHHNIVGGAWSEPGEMVYRDGHLIITGNVNRVAPLGSFTIGASTTGSEYEVFLAKIDTAGQVIWAETYGHDANAKPADLDLDAAGNIYLTGQTYDTIAFNNDSVTPGDDPLMWIAKLDPQGSPIWLQSIGERQNFFTDAMTLKVTPDGISYLAIDFRDTIVFQGDTIIGQSFPEDILLLALQPDGTMLWNRHIASSSEDKAQGMDIDPAGNIYLSARYNPVLTVGDTLLQTGSIALGGILKLDALGRFLWRREVQQTGFCWPTDFHVIDSSHYAIAGNMQAFDFVTAQDTVSPPYGFFNFTGKMPGDSCAMRSPALTFISDCDSTGGTLNAPSGYASYTWSDGQTGQSIQISDTGLYFAVMTDTTGCSFTSTIEQIPPYQLLQITTSDSMLCPGDSATLSANLTAATIVWSTGDTGTSIAVDSAGIYWATAILDSCTFMDSIVISALAASSDSFSVVACDSFQWPVNGVTYMASGIYSETFVNALGCDSMLTLVLTINNSTITHDTIAACDAFTWSVNNITYQTTGMYADTFQNQFGCDSVHVLNLTINTSDSITVPAIACDSFFWPVTSQTYFTSGTYHTVLTNGNNCDSTVTLDLTINVSERDTQEVSACDQYTWPVSGITYAVSSVDSMSFSNQNGCDSTVFLDLIIHQSVESTMIETACDQYTWPVNGQIYEQSGVYTDSLQTVNGCDSVLVLDLTINSSHLSQDSAVSCFTYTWPVNQMVYTSSGTYVDSFSTASGCDSVFTLFLTIETVDVAVSDSANTLTAEADDAQYQWIDCATDDAIAGATAQTFSPDSSGSYAVEVLQNGCIDTSACQEIVVVGLHSAVLNDGVRIFPNPTQDWITIENHQRIRAYRLVDHTGRMILSGTICPAQLELGSKVGAGVYHFIGETSRTTVHESLIVQ